MGLDTNQFSSNFDIAINWVYSSGNWGTLALQTYTGTPVNNTNDAEFSDTNWNAQSIPYLTSRNNYRYEPYHRLDISAGFHKQKKHGIRTWNIGFYNAYNHFNPFITFVKTKSVFDQESQQLTSVHSLSQISILPVIPSLTYSYKF